MSRPEDGALYVGQVVHRRARPRRHSLCYEVFALLADLDRLDDLAGRLRLFSIGRFNVFSLALADFGGHDGTSPATFIRRRAAQAGILAPIGRVRVLCYPRLFGFAFNPLTIYYAEDLAGRLVLLVYEVHNTFGEHHFYDAVVEPTGDALIRHEAKKAFYVSPFNTLAGCYRFSMRPPGDAVFAGVTLADEDGGLVTAFFTGERRPLSDLMLARLAVAYPLMTLKVYFGILWEALKLRLKGVPTTLHLRHPAPPAGAPCSGDRVSRGDHQPQDRPSDGSARP